MPGKKKEFKYDIIKELGVIWESDKGGSTKEVNLISYNDAEPKIDIRLWKHNNDEAIMGKGITLTEDEARTLIEILQDYLEK